MTAVDEREHLGEVLASNTVPLLTYAVQMRDEKEVQRLLAGRTTDELMALVIVLAACHPIDTDGTAKGLLARLRAERERQGITQVALAHAAGYSPNAIYLAESGRHGTRLDTAADCAQALGLRVVLAPAGEAL